MNENIQAVEQNIDALEPSGFFDKHNVVLRIAKIDEAPYTDFNALRDDLLAGRAIVRLAPSTGISSGVFSLFVSPIGNVLSRPSPSRHSRPRYPAIGLTIFGDS